METNDSSISVVIAAIVGSRFLDDCLNSIQSQADEFGADVIVVASGTPEFAAQIADSHPWVRVISRPPGEGVPSLRRRGVEQATGDIVAVIEEHCIAGKDWLAQARKAFSDRDCVAVGGPVADDNYRRLRDWVVYFVEYNVSMPPVEHGATTFLNGANVAYRREALLAHLDALDDGYWEVVLHPQLLREGKQLTSVPEMVVHHRGPFNFGYYLHQRYLFSRAFSGAQVGTVPASRRAAYLLAAPVIPALLLARMAKRVWKKRYHVGKFIQCVPLVSIALSTLVFGEWVGFLLGGGDALTKVE